MFSKTNRLITTILFFIVYLYNAEKGLKHYFTNLYYGQLQEYDNVLKHSFQPPIVVETTEKSIYNNDTSTRDIANYVLSRDFTQQPQATKVIEGNGTNSNKDSRIAFIHLEENNMDVKFESISICNKRNNKKCIKHSGITETDYLLPKPFYLDQNNDYEYNSIIISIENPIELFISWYTKLHDKDYNNSGLRRMFKHGLSKCFRDIDTFASNGLRSKVRSVNPFIRSCQMRARYCLVGDYRTCKVMKSNDIFIKKLLNLEQHERSDKKIYVLRTNHQFFWTDLKKISKIFGPIDNITQNNSTNNVISKDGLKNLCHYLCEEIQLYKRLIHRADNLNDSERKYSLNQINELCPFKYIYNDECKPIDLYVPSKIHQQRYDKNNTLLQYSIINRNIAFVHIGKTGGTTASKMIRRQCTFSSDIACAKHIAVEEYKSIPKSNETQISKQVQEYYHVRKVNATKYNSFIISVRHPIDRLISWFLHEHPLNGLLPRRKDDDILNLFECYKEINDLATIGLQPTLSNDEKKRYCQLLARYYVTGKLNRSQHSTANYHYYTNDLLHEYNSSQKEIFLLRTNYFWKDWESINYILGGGHNSTIEINHHTHRQNKEHKVIVSNRTISLGGLVNFCKFLCAEIQLYKELIYRAANLNDMDKDTSLNELKETCPIQAIQPICS